MKKFYLHFAAANGTIWLFITLYTAINSSGKHISNFKLYVLFPVLSLIYALFATSKKTNSNKNNTEKQIEDIERRLNELKNEQIVKAGNCENFL